MTLKISGMTKVDGNSETDNVEISRDNGDGTFSTFSAEYPSGGIESGSVILSSKEQKDGFLRLDGRQYNKSDFQGVSDFFDDGADFSDPDGSIVQSNGDWWGSVFSGSPEFGQFSASEKTRSIYSDSHCAIGTSEAHDEGNYSTTSVFCSISSSLDSGNDFFIDEGNDRFNSVSILNDRYAFFGLWNVTGGATKKVYVSDLRKKELIDPSEIFDSSKIQETMTCAHFGKSERFMLISEWIYKESASEGAAYGSIYSIPSGSLINRVQIPGGDNVSGSIMCAISDNDEYSVFVAYDGVSEELNAHIFDMKLNLIDSIALLDSSVASANKLTESNNLRSPEKIAFKDNYLYVVLGTASTAQTTEVIVRVDVNGGQNDVIQTTWNDKIGTTNREPRSLKYVPETNEIAFVHRRVLSFFDFDLNFVRSSSVLSSGFDGTVYSSRLNSWHYQDNANNHRARVIPIDELKFKTDDLRFVSPSQNLNYFIKT